VAAADHEQIGICRLHNERSARKVVPNKLDVELDVGKLVSFGCKRLDEILALSCFHTVEPGDEPWIAPYRRRPHPHRSQPDLPARCLLESKPDGCERATPTTIPPS